MDISLLGSRVLIEMASNEIVTASGMVISKDPETGGVFTGTVVAIGNGSRSERGDLIPVNVEVSNKVLFQYGMDITVEGKSYLLVNESDIIAVI